MKVTVHISFEQRDIEKLDAWRAKSRQTRGQAIMTLLESVERQELPHVGEVKNHDGVIRRVERTSDGWNSGDADD